MKKIKTTNGYDFRCVCGRYLFSLKEDLTIYVKCRRCKRIHKIEIPKKPK